MTRDNRDRLDQFARARGIKVERIALNFDQIEQYQPPPNPAKVTDSRYEGYVTEYGTESWELDALEPTVIEQLIQDKVNEYRDQEIWEEEEEKEREQRFLLETMGDRWEEIRDYLDDNPEEKGDDE